MMKVCSKCGVEKDAGEFYVKKNKKLSSWCKRCSSIISAEYYKRPETKLLKKNYVSLESTKALIRGYQLKPKSILKRLMFSARKRGFACNMSESDIAFLIERDKVCYYCGYSLQRSNQIKDFCWKYDGPLKKVHRIALNLSGYAHKSQNLTFDRRDSLSDYSVENCVMCCSLCNDFKGWAIHEDDYKIIAESIINRIVNICKEAGME